MNPASLTEAEFLDGVHANPTNTELQRRLNSIRLPECYLTAGCLFQTVWNRISGQPPHWGIKDYDVFYFDESDTSWEAEDRVIREITDKTADLSTKIEVKNQARVHLWYTDRFGAAYPRLSSSRHGIDLYLIACTSVGIEVQSGNVYAPNGLDELAQGVLRMNPLNPNPQRFMEKAASYKSRWPWLTVATDRSAISEGRAAKHLFTSPRTEASAPNPAHTAQAAPRSAT